jgi:hypothetical protein
MFTVALQRSNMRLKLFQDKVCITVDLNGSSSMTGTFAINEAEEFINREDVEFIDLKYAINNNHDMNILVIYREKKI